MFTSEKNQCLKINRNVAIDFIRVLMSFFVIYTHSVQYTNELVSLPIGSIEHFVCMALYALSLIAVPSFLMISSSFLSNNNEKSSYNLKLVKKILASVLCLIIWSIFSYYVIMWDSNLNVAENFLNCFFMLTNSIVIGPMWYMHAYILFLILSPILKKIINIVSIKEFIYLFILYSVIVPIPNTVSQVFKVNGEIYMAKFFPELAFVFIFFIAGGIFKKNINIIKIQKIKYIIGILCVSIMYWFNYNDLAKDINYDGMLHISGYYSIYNPIFSILIFCLFISVEDKINEWFNKHVFIARIVCNVASTTFIIYLSGTIFIHILTPYIMGWFVDNVVFATFVLTVFSWCAAFLFGSLWGICKSVIRRSVKRLNRI